MEISLEKSQDERTKRAQEALAEGTVTIHMTGPSQWIVQNGDHEPYTVIKHDLGDYTCSCMDFSRIRKTGLRCKHIEAVRLTSERKPTEDATKPNHKEEQMNEQENSNNGWVKLYHPIAGGVQCTLPLTMVALTPDQAKGMFESLNRLLEAGFVTTQQGLENGETREAVTHLAKRSKVNQDGTVTPIVDVYCNGNFKVVGIYLNNLDDQEAFNDAFGIGLNKIPLWEGDSSIERGKNAERDKKYVIPVSGVDVIYKINPKWEGDDDKKHQKRMFVRWERKALKAVTAPVQAAPQVAPPPPHATSASSTPPADAPVTPVAPVIPVAQMAYADGTPLGENEAEKQTFAMFLKAKGMVPASRDELRSYRQSLAG